NPTDREIVELDKDLSIRFLNVGEKHYEHYYDKLIWDGNVEYTDYNNFTMVCEIITNGKVILFPSDLGQAGQEQMSGYISDVDLYMVEHHGLNKSTNTNYLKKINPKIAVAMN